MKLPFLTDKHIYEIAKASEEQPPGTRKVLNVILWDLVYYKTHYEDMKKAFDWLEEMAAGSINVEDKDK